MSDSFYPCRFCKEPLLVSPNPVNYGRCKFCKVEFRWDNDKDTHMVFFLQQEGIYSIIFRYQEDLTIIWLWDGEGGSEVKRIEFPSTFPDTTPQTALSLARRLLNLRVFS